METFIIKDIDKDVIVSDSKLRKFIFPVYPQEYYIATPEHPIIGTYGLLSSICIIMRDPISTKTSNE